MMGTRYIKSCNSVRYIPVLNINSCYQYLCLIFSYSNPTDITIDIVTHDVFWVDTQEDAIYKVDYKGEQKQNIRRNTPSPRGLSILKGNIYWVDRNLENIFKASKLPKQVASPEVVKTGLEKLRDIVLVDRQNQPLDKMNPCYKSGNGNCEQLCFSYPADEKLTSSSRKCECAFGSLRNGRKCAVVTPCTKGPLTCLFLIFQTF